NFGSGFLAAGFSSVAGLASSGLSAKGLVISAVAGGVGSVLGGGKFANGAITGAFAYLASDMAQGAAQSNQFAGPGATKQRPWGISDFVKHYFWGGGAPIDLNDVGLADEFENSSS